MHSLLIVWADNADACAKQYAGTGALKTDFTRSEADLIHLFLYENEKNSESLLSRNIKKLLLYHFEIY